MIKKRHKTVKWVLMCKRDGSLSTLDEDGNWQTDEGYSVYMNAIMVSILLCRMEVLGEL